MKLFTILLALLVLPLGACLEKEPQKTGLGILQPYAFVTAESARSGAAFMVIENHGPEDDRLIAAESNVADFTEVHENYVDPDDGMMMMRKIAGIDLPAGEKTILKPAGYHIMLIRLKEPLKEGASFDLALIFERAGEKTVQVKIKKPGSMVHVH